MADHFRRWAPALTIVASGLLMLVWTWRTWPDVLVDFGRELYVPWRLAHGEVLYRDVAYFNGPLSPYVNALWFRLFGTSLLTLVVANLAITAGIAWLLFGLLAEIGGRFAATVAGVVFLTTFAFAELAGIGNYNFVCPYSHELTHGVALALVALACVARWQRTGRRSAVVAAGVAVGLTFLTKPEVFLAAAPATAVGLALARRFTWRALLDFVAAAVVPTIVAGLALAVAIGPGEALRGVLGAWPSVVRGDVASNEFYRSGMGVAHPMLSVAVIGWWTVAYVLLLGALAAAAFAAGTSGTRRWLMLGVAVVAGALFHLLAARGAPAWLDAARPLPIAIVLVGATVVRTPHAGALRLALVVFALVLLAKMALNVHLYQYGFALAMPATLVAVVALVEWIPAWIARRGGTGGLFRIGALALLAGIVLGHLRYVDFWVARKVHRVARGADAFWTDDRGPAVARTLDEIGRRIPADASVAVFPEGVMLNYLARRPSPTPYVNFMPPELAVFGERTMLAALEARPPDWVVLVHKDTSEYGAPLFGRDYGRRVYAWVRRHYREVEVIGARPLRDDRFGLALLARADRVGPLCRRAEAD